MGKTEAKTILIPKEGKAYPEAYHPISLLNTDYKILTSILEEIILRIIRQGLLFKK